VLDVQEPINECTPDSPRTPRDEITIRRLSGEDLQLPGGCLRRQGLCGDEAWGEHGHMLLLAAPGVRNPKIRLVFEDVAQGDNMHKFLDREDFPADDVVRRHSRRVTVVMDALEG